MNRIDVGKKQSERHPTKDVLFDIQSLANQLYHSQSTSLDSVEEGKIYFSENLVSNLWKKGLKQIHILVWPFNTSLKKHEDIDDSAAGYNNIGTGITANDLIELDAGANEELNKIFSEARRLLGLILNLGNVYIQNDAGILKQHSSSFFPKDIATEISA